MAESLYFYKLVSEYPEDVTKNCKLTINEIDSNFKALKDYDIKTAEFIREEKTLVLTKNNNEKLIVPLKDVTYNLEASTGSTESGMSLTIKYDSPEGEKSVKVENILTYDNLRDVIGTDILTKVITDNTLKGNGTMASPLGLAGVERTGSYAPVIGVIDTTKGEKLPVVSKLGTRYITKEFVNDYGLLYNGAGVSEISNKLALDRRGWRVPSKADWDALLNSLEPCEYRNHESAKCHVELGKLAGQFLKSECGWIGQDPCECARTKPFTGCTVEEVVDYADDSELPEPSDDPIEKPCGPGIDKYGMSILPAGEATIDTYGRPQTDAFKERAFFWTTTHVNGDVEQDFYIKEFDWNRCGVFQIAECPNPYYSVRLVKDFDGSNYNGPVVFDGVTYDTLLFPESRQIWLASNYVGKENITEKNFTEVNAGDVPDNRIEYYINEWNGKYWERKRMNEADTVVVENPVYDTSGNTIEICWYDTKGEKECVEVDIPTIAQSNIEYRVYTEDGKCDKILVNVDDSVVERVLNVVLPMLEHERDERIAADEILSGMIETETAERISADTELWEAVNTISGDVEDLRHDLDEEISARTEADEVLSGAIDTLREDLDDEIERATEREDEIEEELLEEIERAKAAEDEISGLTIDTSVDYTLSASTENETYNMILKSKDGINDHFVKIKFDGNFGEI